MASSELLIAAGTVGGGGDFLTMLLAGRDEKLARKFRKGSISWVLWVALRAMRTPMSRSAVRGFILPQKLSVKD